MQTPGDIPRDRIRPLYRDEYDLLVEQGVFEGEPIELLRGALVVMSPQGDEHTDACDWLAQRITLALGDMRLRVRSAKPFAASDDSEPEPDVLVADTGYERRGHPTSALLVIEVARTSLRRDRGIKREIYAQAGVPEYWIVDLVNHVVEVHTEPTADGYAQLRTLGRDGVLRPHRLPAVEIAIADIPGL